MNKRILLLLKRTFAVQSKKKTVSSTDKRYPVLKELLYSDEKRPDFNFTPEQRQQHELIERMWCLSKQREKDETEILLRNQYISMRQAALALEKADPRLFKAATEIKEYDPLEPVSTFSPKLRIPTTTLPKEQLEE